MEGPPGDIEVDVDRIEVLLAQQHPNLATLPLRPCEHGFVAARRDGGSCAHAAREAVRLADFLRALHVPAPAGASRNADRTKPTWIHGDLHPRNVLTLDGTITGVIDWSDMASGDTAIDLACLWMLLPDAAARETVRRAYGSSDEALWLRARGWAVLFGVMLLDTGLAGNARNAALGEQILQRM